MRKVGSRILEVYSAHGHPTTLWTVHFNGGTYYRKLKLAGNSGDDKSRKIRISIRGTVRVQPRLTKGRMNGHDAPP
jgi:hypothetical protein